MPDFSWSLGDPIVPPPPGDTVASTSSGERDGSTYVEYEPIASPPWHRGPWGVRFHEALGLVKDFVVLGARLAVRERWVSTCSTEALALHGKARGWPQAPGETSGEYRSRLRSAWQLAQWRGTRYGIELAFALLGMPNVEVYESFTAGWGRYAGDATKTKWLFVVLRPPHPFGADFSFRWGDGTKWGEKTYGVSGDARLFELLRQVVRAMKPAHCHVETLAIVLSGDIKHTGASDDGQPDVGAAVAYLHV